MITRLAARRALRTVLALALALALFAIAAAVAALQALRAQPGEWSVPLRVGPFTHALGAPALLRIATHPLGLALLDGRRTGTPFGVWTWQRGADDSLIGRCAPCRLRLAALGPAPLELPAAVLTLRRRAPDRFHGRLLLGDGARPVALDWRAELSAGGLAIEARLPTTPIAEAYAALGPVAIPELAGARIGGTFGATLRARWPEGRLEFVAPRVEGFEVAGLGTERLLGAEPPQRCRAPAPGAARRALTTTAAADRVVGWLPRAVVAAEDQRFDEHAGFDLAQLLSAWSANQRPPGDGPPAAAPGGASTLTQQLAKLLFAGDERSATRKLRELLYAVEMERTLGKGRILQLYLAMAPWGDGVCGAEAASRHYLSKPSARLTPLEAAWLASLLRDGRGAEEPLDRVRVAWVLASLRGPLSAERRAEQLEALRGWTPPAPAPSPASSPPRARASANANANAGVGGGGSAGGADGASARR